MRVHVVRGPCNVMVLYIEGGITLRWGEALSIGVIQVRYTEHLGWRPRVVCFANSGFIRPEVVAPRAIGLPWVCRVICYKVPQYRDQQHMGQPCRRPCSKWFGKHSDAAAVWCTMYVRESAGKFLRDGASVAAALGVPPPVAGPRGSVTGSPRMCITPLAGEAAQVALMDSHRLMIGHPCIA